MKFLAKLSLPLLMLSLALPAYAQKTLTEDDVVAIVKRVIKEQPELIMDSLQSMRERDMANQQQQQSAALKTSKKQLTENPLSPVIGNPKGDVTVVEFFDYHCGYCKRMLPVMRELVESDKKVKVVFKEFPILSPDSKTAAQAALAVNKLAPKKYFDFHQKLMEHNGAFSEPALIAMGKELGVDGDDMKKTMHSKAINDYLAEVADLAKSLGIQGTPAMVIGDELIPGAADVDTLKASIAKARAAK